MKARICPKCNKHNSPVVKRCMYCTEVFPTTADTVAGHKKGLQTEDKVCSQCEHHNPPYARYCAECGESLVPTLKQRSVVFIRKSFDRIQKKPNKIQGLLYGICVFCIALAIFFRMPAWVFVLLVLALCITSLLYFDSIVSDQDDAEFEIQDEPWQDRILKLLIFINEIMFVGLLFLTLFSPNPYFITLIVIWILIRVSPFFVMLYFED